MIYATNIPYYLPRTGMAQTTRTVPEFWAELETIGEDEVRLKLARSFYGDPGAERRAVVEEWLRRKDRKRQNRTEFVVWASMIVATVAAIIAFFAWVFPIK
jgi:hypothetical protein